MEMLPLGGKAGPYYRRDDGLDEDSDDEADDDNVASADSSSAEWKEGMSTPDLCPFTGDSGLQVKMEDGSPLEYLRLMINDEMMQNIVTETNRYAAETLRDKHLSRCSRFQKWVDVTDSEMWAFFGLIIAMGLIVIDDLDEYWSLDSIFNLPLFRSVMRRDRFNLILSFLHVCDNNEQLPYGHPSHDPLFKIRRFVDQLRDNFQKVFKPGKNIAVDEAMVAWRGPLAFRVYTPDRPIKLGIKVYELCDSGTRYCCNLEFYTGKQQCSPFGASFDVVSRLIKPYLGCGRTLFVDSSYTSPGLFDYLKKNNTLACGTLCINVKTKNAPPKGMLLRHKKGSTNSTMLTNGTLNLIRFFDRREVTILTSAHDATKVTTAKCNPDSGVPIVRYEAVNDYNKYMGSVDRCDQIVTYNAFKRRTMKWWKKAFFHMYMLGVVNAFLVHKATSTKKMTHRLFRRELAKQLIQWVPIPPCPSLKPRDVGDSSLLRLSARHFPDVVQRKPGKKSLNPQRDCVVCSEPGKRRHSRYECVSCDVGLHVVPCFRIYHSNKNYKYKRVIDKNPGTE